MIRTGCRSLPGTLGILVALLLLLPGPRAGTQSLSWNDISGPEGFSGIESLSDGTLYGQNGFTLFRSTDDGESWLTFPRPGGVILDFRAKGNTTVLAIGNFNVANYKQYFVSTDRAENWERVYTEGSFGPVHTRVTLLEDGTIYAIFPNGSRIVVEKFMNGFWQQVGNPPQIYYVSGAPLQYTVMDIDSARNLFIGTVSDGIHSSRDNGETWTKALPYRYVSAVAVGPGGRAVVGTLPNGRTAGGVFVSDDHGLTWQFYDLTDVFIRAVRVSPSGEIFVVADEGIYRRTPGAVDWEVVGPFDITYSFLGITPSGKFIATAEGYGLLVSTDAGQSWATDGVRHQDLYSIASTPDGTILAGTVGKGYFRTTDRGGKWTQHRDSADPSYFYAMVNSPGGVYAATEKGLYVTNDNGMTLTSLTGALNSDSVDLPVFAVDRSAGGEIYIGTGAGVWRSTDGGTTWAPAGLGEFDIRSIALHQDRIYVATVSDGVFLSTNGGTSWQNRGLVRPDLQTIAVNGAGVVYAGVAGGIYFSTNGGGSWTSKIFTSGHVYAFLFNGNFDTYAATSTGLFATTDGGESWGSRGLGERVVIALSYDLNHGMLAASYKDGVYRTFQIITAADRTGTLPLSLRLYANYPNPFNPLTTIAYDVPVTSEVTLTLYDVLGRNVATLVSGTVPPGNHQATWDGSSSPSGVYLYRITVTPLSVAGTVTRPFEATGKMMLLR